MEDFKRIDSLRGTVEYFDSVLLGIRIREEVDNDKKPAHNAIVLSPKQLVVYFGVFGRYYDIVMPKIGEEILFTSSLQSKKSGDYYLDCDSCIYRSSIMKETDEIIPDSELSTLIKDYNLTVIDLYTLNTIYPNIYIWYDSVRVNFSRSKLILLKHFLKVNGKMIVPPTIYSILDLFTIKPIYGEINYYQQYVKQSFDHENLFGIIHLAKYARFELSQNNSESILCQIMTPNNNDLWELPGKLVVISKFILIEEILEETKTRYLMCNFKDIHIIDNPCNYVEITFPPKQIPPEYYKEVLDIYIESISMMYWVDNAFEIECWLLVQIAALDSINWRSYCLCLEGNLVKYRELLECTQYYRLNLNHQLIPYKNLRVHGTNSIYPTLKMLDGTGIITRLKCNTRSRNPPQRKLIEVENFFKEKNYKQLSVYVNFEQELQLKYFINPQFPSFANKVPNPDFGCPGKKQHILRFHHKAKDVRCILYINNFELRLYPLGLIEHARVRISHAYYKKESNYIKCDPFTNIKIIGFNSKVRYNSADELNQHFIGNLSPYAAFNLLYKANAYLSKVVTIRLMYDKVIEKLTCILVMDVKSSVGFSKVESTSWSFISNILFNGENDRVYRIFVELFKPIGFYSRYIEDTPTFANDQHRLIYKIIDAYISRRIDNVIYIDMLVKHVEPRTLSNKNSLVEKSLWEGIEFYKATPEITRHDISFNFPHQISFK